MRVVKQLLAVSALLSACTMAACASDEDCKAVADALGNTAIVPNHVLIVSRAIGKFESVHTQNAYYETFQGVWRQLPYNDAEQAARMRGAFQGRKAECTLRGVETLDDRAVQHYAATEHLKKGDALHDFWISPADGKLLKGITKFGEDEVTMTYDYADIKAPM